MRFDGKDLRWPDVVTAAGTKPTASSQQVRLMPRMRSLMRCSHNDQIQGRHIITKLPVRQSGRHNVMLVMS